jgi:preprotein translocase subunit YajC
MKEVYEAMVSTMSDEDIMTLWRCVANEHKRRKKVKGSENKKLLKKGDRVSFPSRHGTITGTITKVKRVNALIKADDYQTWDVRLGSLTKIA